jgi:uncharacterized membrane protein
MHPLDYPDQNVRIEKYYNMLRSLGVNRLLALIVTAYSVQFSSLKHRRVFNDCIEIIGTFAVNCVIAWIVSYNVLWSALRQYFDIEKQPVAITVAHTIGWGIGGLMLAGVAFFVEAHLYDFMMSLYKAYRLTRRKGKDE